MVQWFKSLIRWLLVPVEADPVHRGLVYNMAVLERQRGQLARRIFSLRTSDGLRAALEFLENERNLAILSIHRLKPNDVAGLAHQQGRLSGLEHALIFLEDSTDLKNRDAAHSGENIKQLKPRATTSEAVI